MYRIEKTLNANALIKFSESNGLHDIRSWTNTEKIQSYLDSGEYIGFIARNFDENNSNPIVGAIMGGFEEEGRIWLELIVVSKNYRRKGIGGGLINKIFKKGKEKEFRACFVDVDDDNYDAIKFYKKLGFKQVGKIDYYYYDNKNALIFMKNL